MSKGNESAYPTQMWDEELKEASWLDGGLSKRELFAAMAMQGAEASNGDFHNEAPYYTPEEIAKRAVKIADALLKELSKEAE